MRWKHLWSNSTLDLTHSSSLLLSFISSSCTHSQGVYVSSSFWPTLPLHSDDLWFEYSESTAKCCHVKHRCKSWKFNQRSLHTCGYALSWYHLSKRFFPSLNQAPSQSHSQVPLWYRLIIELLRRGFHSSFSSSWLRCLEISLGLVHHYGKGTLVHQQWLALCHQQWSSNCSLTWWKNERWVIYWWSSLYSPCFLWMTRDETQMTSSCRTLIS